MKTATDRLRFAVAFAGMNLDTFRPGDWSNLRADLAAFVGTDGEPVSASGGIVPVLMLERPLPLEYPEEACRQLQRETLLTLDAIADRAAPSTFDLSGEICLTVTKRLILWPSPPGESRPAAAIMVQGNVRGLFHEILWALLTREPLPPIRKCPECGALFFRVRRQKYCTRACANRVNMRRFLQKAANRTAKREADHRAYKRRLRRGAQNARLKVTRRASPARSRRSA